MKGTNRQEIKKKKNKKMDNKNDECTKSNLFFSAIKN